MRVSIEAILSSVIALFLLFLSRHYRLRAEEAEKDLAIVRKSLYERESDHKYRAEEAALLRKDLANAGLKPSMQYCALTDKWVPRKKEAR
jgi:hypothetical protein